MEPWTSSGGNTPSTHGTSLPHWVSLAFSYWLSCEVILDFGSGRATRRTSSLSYTTLASVQYAHFFIRRVAGAPLLVVCWFAEKSRNF